MICPFCSNKTTIYNSRSTHAKTQTWRRHRCTNCSRLFTTKERVDWSGKTQIQTTDGTTGYNRDRLLLSLVRASQGQNLATNTLTELTDTIELALQQNGIFSRSAANAKEVSAQATEVLQRFDKHLALQYVNQIYRNKPPLELIKRLLGP